MNNDPLKRVSKAHTRYKTSDGTIVPGATTITGIRDKSGVLVPWANKLGLEGIDSRTYVDESAKVGTLAHAMIQAHLQKTKVDTRDFTAAQIDLAENAILSFLNWEKQHVIEPIFLEEKFVSDSMRYGGTVDCYCKLDGKPVLLDFKTGKSIYPEYFMQVSAYAELLREAGNPVEEVRILRVGRDESEGFEERAIDLAGVDMAFDMFTNLLDFYYAEKRFHKFLKGDK